MLFLFTVIGHHLSDFSFLPLTYRKQKFHLDFICVSRSVVKDVLVRVLQGMLGAYESLLVTRKKGSKSDMPLSQQEALQAVFNVKYILHMIPWRDDSEV